jgi:hypothetical protein
VIDSRVVVIAGLFVFPVCLVNWCSIIIEGSDVVSGLVACRVLLTVVISVTELLVYLYWFYLP